METFDKIKEIVNKGARKLTEEDKKLLVGLAEENEIEFAPTTCKSCYIDLAMQLAQIYKKEEKEVGRKLWLKKGTNVLLNGKLVNEFLYDTDEKCEELIKCGMPLRYFEKSE